MGFGRCFVGCVVAALWIPGTGCSRADDDTVSTGSSSAEHYRLHKDGKSLYAVMHDSVDRGDSIEKVEGLLGPGHDHDVERASEACKKLAAKNPAQWPDGFRDDDRIVAFDFDDSSTLWLQFRNGKLINHNPGDFAEYEPMVSAISSQPSS